MLQYSTIEPGTLDVLKRLMSLPELGSFNLAGGTALALYYGHRLSVDIDLFSSVDFDSESIVVALEGAFPEFTYSAPNVVGIFGFIGNIKVDFVRYHRYQAIGAPFTEAGVRLMSTEDIMAMKVAAILKRAVKKDFWDIAEILEHHSLDEIINSYNRKFPNQQLLISIPQALTYFVDAEDSEDPVGFKGQTWEGVKKKIGNKVKNYLN